MHYLPYLTPADTEITIEKLDKVAKTLSDKLKNFAKLFGIFLSWCIFNIIVALFIDRTRSLSLDAYRVITDGLRSISTQDLLFIITLFFGNKLGCFISIAMAIAFEMAFFVQVLNPANESAVDGNVNKRDDYAQSKLQSGAYVVSYKQQVAFLA